MRRNLAHAGLGIATLVMLTMISLPAQASHCSQGAAAGKYSYTYTGTVFTPDPLPAAAVGHFSQDAKGNITGGQTHTLTGSTEVEDISGTATVSDDCTATATISVFLNGVLLRTATLNLVYDNGGDHARMIFTSLTLADGTVLPVVITVDATRISPGKN